MKLHADVKRGDGNIDSDWHNYHCAHCDKDVVGAVLAQTPYIFWLLCPKCQRGSVHDTLGNDKLYPSAGFGPFIDGLPDEVKEAYEECRQCFSISAYVAAELLCRKLLMHIAVDKGADEGKSFEFYLDYLQKEQYITPPMRSWADIIRQHGNKSTHRIEKVSKERAENTMMFTAELLRLIYEMEFMKNKYLPPSNP